MLDSQTQESYNHRVFVWVAQDLKRSSSANTQPKAGTTFTVQLLKAPYALTSDNSSDVASISSLGNSFQNFTTYIVNNLFLMSNLNVTILILKQFTLILWVQIKKKFFLLFFQVSFKYWRASVSLQWAVLRTSFSPSYKPSVLSAFLHSQVVLASQTLLWTSIWPTPVNLCPSFVGSPKAGYNIPILTAEELGGRITSLNFVVTLLFMMPVVVAFLGCKSTLQLNVQFFIQQYN